MVCQVVINATTSMDKNIQGRGIKIVRPGFSVLAMLNVVVG